jgi:hypothetical protein
MKTLCVENTEYYCVPEAYLKSGIEGLRLTIDDKIYCVPLVEADNSPGLHIGDSGTGKIPDPYFKK